MKRLALSTLLPLLLSAASCTEREEPASSGVPPPEHSLENSGYVLYPEDGEVLVPCREGASAEGRWIIKADPVNTGSHRVAMGTQVLPGGERIPVHRHEHQDEVLFIHEGTATGILGDSSVAIGPGTTVYVPQGVWHGVDNTETASVQIVWVIVPPGLEGFFRDIGVPPGTDCVPLPAEDMAEIRRRHGITQKIE
jgi:mannose-6-phosphate isomerase-like protein (cupin superfamily)